MTHKLAVIILAAGQGTRMKSSLPKILHPLGGKAMVHHVIDVALSLDPSQVIVVVSPTLDQDRVRGGRDIDVVIQEEPLGTGDAVKSALSRLSPEVEDVLVLCGDVPLIIAEDLKHFIAGRRHNAKDILMLAMDLDNPRQYGRLITQRDSVQSIVEYKDLTPEQRGIHLCNSGIYMVPRLILGKILECLKADNAAQEYYLTDIVAHAGDHGVETRYVLAQEPETLHGINNRIELSMAELSFQERWRRHHMLEGVTLLDPSTTYFSHDTIIGKDTIVYPNVVFGSGVIIGENAVVYPGCFLVNSTLGNSTKVGPYAHLREGTILDEAAEVGNFVECKKTYFAPKAKAKHLSYLGDTQVGQGANVGAGTITCNYDGFKKSQTIIEEGAFIGSNSALVAPVRIGKGAMVSAGSTVTKDVPSGALAVARSRQENKLDWSTRFRSRFLKD